MAPDACCTKEVRFRLFENHCMTCQVTSGCRMARKGKRICAGVRGSIASSADLLPVEVGSSGKLIHFLVGKIRLLRVQSDPFLKNPRLSRRVVRPFCSALALGLVYATTVRLLAALMSGFIVAKSCMCRWRHKVCLRRHNRIACIDA